MIVILELTYIPRLIYLVHFSDYKTALIQISLLHERAHGAIDLIPRLLQHPVDVHVGACHVAQGSCRVVGAGAACGGLRAVEEKRLVFF